MKKGEVSVKPLLYFISFIIGLILVCMIGVKNTYALEYETLGNLVDITVLYASPDYTDSPIELPPNQSLYLEEVRNLTYIVENYNFIANTHYQLESQLKGVTLTNANYYEVTDENGNNCLISYEYSILYGDYPRWNFQCPYNTKSVAISISNNNNEYLFDPGNFEWSTAVLSKTNTSINYDSTDTDNIINNNNQNTDKIIESNKETQEVIKEQFNSCRPSYNLINFQDFKNSLSTTFNITSLDNNSISIKRISTNIYTYLLSLKENTQYTISFNFKNSESYDYYIYFRYTDGSSSIIVPQKYYENFTYIKATSTSGKTVKGIEIQLYGWNNNLIIMNDIMLQEGTVATDYEPYGEKICSNKLDEAENTRKGILQTIIDLPRKIVDFIGDLLKSLFIPEEGYFENWFNTIKIFFEEKLGFLATPFTIIIDFINRYLDLNPSEDIIINIPDITVPNFEEHKIISETSFNWSQLLKSKESLNSLWQLYLAFVDVFLILNFINLCENKYNRIFGGDTTPYEYYTVEESYTIDDKTGEAKNHRLSQRTTTRKKVNK